MTLPTVAADANAPESLALFNLARTLANSAAWQIWCGVDGDPDPAASAEAFIWFLEPDAGAAYPRATLWTGQLRPEIIAAGGAQYEDHGILGLVIEAEWPEAYRGQQLGNVYTWLLNSLGTLEQDMKAQADTVNRIRFESFHRGGIELQPIEEEETASGWYCHAVYRGDWR